MSLNLNNLKKHIFFEFINMVGRVFIVVRYSDRVIIGNRGFTSEEKENGIVLVFNSKMKFHWDEQGINATLVFGTTPQKCFIPEDDIIAIYSPDLYAQFVVSPQPTEVSSKSQGLFGYEPLSGDQSKISHKEGIESIDEFKTKKEQKVQKDKKGGHIIKVDFTKNRR